MPRTNFKTAARSLLLVSISALALAACGTTDSDAMSQKSAAPMPPITEMDAAMAAPAPKPLPLSETDTLTPVMPAASAAATDTVTTVTTASGPTDATVEARMAKMEATVNSLRADYDRIMPAFASLNTTNDRIQKLLDEMETEGKLPPGTAASAMSKTTTTTTATTTMKGAAPVIAPAGTVSKATPMASAKKPDDTMMPPVAKATAPAAMPETAMTTTTTTSTEKTEVAEKAPAPASGSGNTVTAVRIGEHGEKTRLVFDITSKTKPEFKYDLDNGEKILMVEMPTSAWTAKESGKPNSPLISSWASQKGTSGGTAVAIQLKKDARVLSSQFLPAEGKDPARLVMDIASGG